jgi:hypothetical protein
MMKEEEETEKQYGESSCLFFECHFIFVLEFELLKEINEWTKCMSEKIVVVKNYYFFLSCFLRKKF